MYARVFLSIFLTFSILNANFAQQPKPSPDPKQTSPAQQKPPGIDSPDVVKITTNLVQIDVSVTKGDKPISDLQPEDFEIFEDGKAQTITNFSYVSNVREAATPQTPPAATSREKIATPIPPARITPGAQRRTMALVVDDLGISWESMDLVKTQIKKVIDELSPDDLLAIIRTGGDVGALQQFTNDKRVLLGALGRLRWNPCSRAGLHVFEPLGQLGPSANLCSQYVMSSTLNSLKFILNGMSQLPGRKSMVVFSDYLPIEDQQPSAHDQTLNATGDSSVYSKSDPRSTSTEISPDDSPVPNVELNYYGQLQRLAEVAIRSSVVIYGVDSRALQYTGLTAADRVPFTGSSKDASMQAMRTMGQRSDQLVSGREGADLIARQTGGFLIMNSNGGLKRIMDDQQGYYLLGFRPGEETFNRGFHHIKVRLKQSGYNVRTREGFYGFTTDQARPPILSTTDAMNKALISPFGAHEVSMRLTTFFIDEGKGAVLRSFVYLDPHDLTFRDAPDGLRTTNVELKTMLFGDNGRVIEQAKQSGSLGVRPADYDRILRDGLIYSFDVPMKVHGGVQFRVAMRDVDSGHIGSAGQFVEIPNLQNGSLTMSGIVVREEKPARPAAADQAADDVTTGPAVRRFHQGSTADFIYMIYNATQASKLTAQTRLLRDGKVLSSPAPVEVNMSGQSDPQHLTNGSRLQLAPDMPPGDYVLQIIVTDSLDKQKPRVTSQWIDFEIVK